MLVKEEMRRHQLHCMVSIDILKIDCLMARTACRVCLVSTVSGCCKNSLKSKRQQQAQNKASTPSGQSGLCNVCFCFVPATSALVLLKWLFHKLKCDGQSTFLKDRLHWRCLLAKLSVTVTLDCTCLGHLGRCDTDRIMSIYVTLPKVAKASKY